GRIIQFVGVFDDWSCLAAYVFLRCASGRKQQNHRSHGRSSKNRPILNSFLNHRVELPIWIWVSGLVLSPVLDMEKKGGERPIPSVRCLFEQSGCQTICI